LYPHRRKNTKVSIVSFIAAKMMPGAVPASSPARRQSRKLLLNDLKIEVDRGNRCA
jgi:hypothetical protein